MRSRTLISFTVAGLALAISAAAEQPRATNSTPSPGDLPGAAPLVWRSGGDYSAWVKLCEKNAAPNSKEICLINNETIDINSGLPIVAATVRRIEGDAKEQLLVMLPQAMRLPAGVSVNVDDGEPIVLADTYCHGIYCETAVDLSKELLGKLRQGKQLTVAFFNLQGQAFALPVNLAGFSKAYDGPSADAAKYREARGKLVQTMRKRQTELAAQAKSSQAATSASEGPSPSQPQPVYPEGSPSAEVEGSQLAVNDADSVVEAFCEATAVSAKSVGPDKDGFMSWCRPEAAKLLPSPAP
jgi:invasion protein IalB